MLFRAADIDWQLGCLREAFCNLQRGRLQRVGAVALPPVIYDYSSFLDEAGHRLLNRLGVRCVFNHFGAPFDKWSLHRRLASCPWLGSALPETRLYRSSNDVRQLLQRHREVLLKPLALSRGRGIFLLNRQRLQNGAWTKQLLPETSYLVQQRVDLLTLAGRTLDFRLYLQRNAGGVWQISAAAARQAASTDLLLTNLALGGTALPPLTALYNQDADWLRGQEQLLWRRVCALGLLTARQTANSYSSSLLGELGIDIGLDKAGRAWLLEVNNKPGKTCLQQTPQTMLQALQTPVKFAAYLQKTLA